MTITSSPPAIAATGLRKSYGDKVVLDGIDLNVAEGTIFSLLGPNGAGKTTAVQILSTLIGADGGEVRVAGHDLARDPDAVRAAIGVTGQFSAVDNLLTGQENLILMADLHHLGRAEGRRRTAELLDRFDLAMTLVGDSRIIFLDEPTTGLDPRSRRAMWQTIRDLVAGGVTVFLTTQYLDRPTNSPTGSPCSTTGDWSPRAPRTSSSGWSPAGTSDCNSPNRAGWTRFECAPVSRTCRGQRPGTGSGRPARPILPAVTG